MLLCFSNSKEDVSLFVGFLCVGFSSVNCGFIEAAMKLCFSYSEGDMSLLDVFLCSGFSSVDCGFISDSFRN